MRMADGLNPRLFLADILVVRILTIKFPHSISISNNLSSHVQQIERAVSQFMNDGVQFHDLTASRTPDRTRNSVVISDRVGW